MARDVSGTYDFSNQQHRVHARRRHFGGRVRVVLDRRSFFGTVHLYVDTRAFLTWWNAIFFQDDFKLSQKVNMSIGIRWEADTGMTEGRGDLMAGFSHTDNNPACNCPGAITFPDRSERDRLEQHHAAPRPGVELCAPHRFAVGRGDVLQRSLLGQYLVDSRYGASRT